MLLFFTRHQGQQLRWLATGILIGIVTTYLGLTGVVLIVAGVAIVAYCRGYRIMLTKNDTLDDDRL